MFDRMPLTDVQVAVLPFAKAEVQKIVDETKKELKRLRRKRPKASDPEVQKLVVQLKAVCQAHQEFAKKANERLDKLKEDRRKLEGKLYELGWSVQYETEGTPKLRRPEREPWTGYRPPSTSIMLFWEEFRQIRNVGSDDELAVLKKAIEKIERIGEYVLNESPKVALSESAILEKALNGLKKVLEGD